MFYLILTSFVAAIVAVCSQEAEAQKVLASDNLADIKISVLDLRLSTAKRQARESAIHLSVLRIIEEHFNELTLMNQILRGEAKGSKDKAEKFVKLTEELLSSSELQGLPKQYPEEIFPVLFAQLQGRPLPKVLTPLQKRIVKASNGKFEKMTAEVKLIIKEDIKSLETKQSTLQEEISSIEKELEALRKKKR